MLLLIDDKQTKILDLDRIAKQSVRPNDDIDSAVFEALFGGGKFFCANKPRGVGYIDGQAVETCGKSLEVLT